jgi:large subunit ribosomal protein L21
MYAVIETGGKQYRVAEGDVIDVELTSVSEDEARTVNFDRVLMISSDTGVKVGSPVVSGASVSGVLVNEVRAPKIRIFKKKRRKGHRKSAGHRQDLLRVRIDAINA